MIYIDGDFSTGKPCQYHCSPTCHPGQVGPKWRYGCLHPGFPANKFGDFCPLVDCGGQFRKCDLVKMYDELLVMDIKSRKEFGWTEKRLAKLKDQTEEIKSKIKAKP